jgi:uncharacterized membrane protein YfcA
MGETLADVLNPSFILGACVAGLSGVLAGYAGFGGALILVPILAYLYSPIEAIGIAAICAFATLLTLFPNAAKTAYWPEAAPVVSVASLSLFAGLTFLVSADPVLIRRGMGVFVTLVALVLMSGWSYRGPRGIMAGGIIGALTGGITGAFGIPGSPISALYFLAAPVSPKIQRANMIVVNTVLVTFLLGGLVVAGIYDAPLLVRAAIITPLFVLGAQLGKHLFTTDPSAWFKKVTLALLLATGLSAIIL